MGKATAKRPTKLSEKLFSIRTSLGCSQNEMARLLGYENETTQSQISAFERGTRIPSLPVLLRYARLAKISTDVLIDDSIDLPKKLGRTV